MPVIGLHVHTQRERVRWSTRKHVHVTFRVRNYETRGTLKNNVRQHLVSVLLVGCILIISLLELSLKKLFVFMGTTESRLLPIGQQFQRVIQLETL